MTNSSCSASGIHILINIYRFVPYNFKFKQSCVELYNAADFLFLITESYQNFKLDLRKILAALRRPQQVYLWLLYKKTSSFYKNNISVNTLKDLIDGEESNAVKLTFFW